MLAVNDIAPSSLQSYIAAQKGSAPDAIYGQRLPVAFLIATPAPARTWALLAQGRALAVLGPGRGQGPRRGAREEGADWGAWDVAEPPRTLCRAQLHVHNPFPARSRSLAVSVYLSMIPYRCSGSD
jgi:hypothetical protein